MKNIVLPALLMVSSIALAAEPSAKAAFVKNNEIFVAKGDLQPMALTHSGIPKSLPVWSRDGSKIAFLEKTDTKRALGTLVVIDERGHQMAKIMVRPVEKAPPQGMRFVEDLEWLDNNKVAVSGSINPSLVETAVIDLKSGAEVDDLYDDGGGPTFSPDGVHVAYETGMPHFSPEDSWHPTLTVDNHPVFPDAGSHVRFLTGPQWAGDSSAVAIVAQNYEGMTMTAVVWHTSGAISVSTLASVANENAQPIDLFWNQGNFYVSSGERTWKLGDNVAAELPPGTTSNPLKQARLEQSRLISTIHDAGGSDVDVWCQSCPLAAMPRRQTVNK